MGSSPIAGSRSAKITAMARYRSYSGRSSYVPRSLRKREKRTKNTLIRNVILGIIIIYLILAWGLPTLVGGLSFLNRFKKVDQPTKVTQDVTIAPPVLNIPYEATNTATIRISGYAAPNSKVEIFLNDDLKDTPTTQDDGSFRSADIALVIGSNSVYGKTLDSQNHESLQSKAIQVSYSSDKPKLNLSSPSDNTQIKGGDKKVTVSGSTDSNDSLTVNGTVVVIGQDGNFSTTIPINDGDNTITVTSTNNFGNSTQVTRKVTYSSS